MGEEGPGLSLKSSTAHSSMVPSDACAWPTFFQSFLHWRDYPCHPHGGALWDILSPWALLSSGNG